MTMYLNTINNTLGEHLSWDTDAMGKQPKWVRLLFSKMASEIRALRQRLDDEVVSEVTRIWLEAPISPRFKIPDKPIGTKNNSVIFGANPDLGYHVRLVGGELEVSLWSGRIVIAPQGGVNVVRIRRET